MKIPIKEATRLLGLEDATSLINGKKYKPYYYRREGNSGAMFDYAAYSKEQDRQTELQEKTKLLIEYLFHIENMSYSKMAKITGLNVQTLSALTFGYSLSVRFLFMIREYYPFHLRRFDEYYDFRLCDKRKYKKTIYGWREL